MGRLGRFTGMGWSVAIAALVMGMAGSATAARLITGKQIRNNSITGHDIKQRSITIGDLSDGAMEGLTGDPGPAGPAGPGGPAGPAGPSGQGITTSGRTPVALGPDGCGAGCDIRIVEATCPSGTQAVTGGYAMVAIGQVWYSERTQSGTGWAVGFDNEGSIDSTSGNEVVVYCAPGQPTPTARAQTPSTSELIAGRVRSH